MATDPVIVRHGFRAEVRKPRSAASGGDVDALTPVAGAPHADPFRVTTLESDSAWGRPILSVPVGRTGKMDPASGTTDKGHLRIELLDERLSADDNFERWVSAFVGDAAAAFQWRGLMVQLWETKDGGTTWTPYFCGRIASDEVDDGGIVWVFQIDDLSGDLEFDVFVGMPHASIAANATDPDPEGKYAYPQTCAPLGLPRRFGGIPAVFPLSGPVTTIAGKKMLYEVDARARRLSINQDFKALADTFYLTGQLDAPNFNAIPTLGFAGNQCDVYCQRFFGDTSILGPYPLRAVLLRQPSGATDGKWRVAAVWAEGWDGDLDVAGTNYSFWIIPRGTVSTAYPLVVDDVHPIQYMRDIALGKFSRLDPATGNTIYAMKINAAAFDALIADASFGTMRALPDATQKAIEYIEDAICATVGVGWYLDGEGQFTPVDLRVRTPPEPQWVIRQRHLLKQADAFTQGGGVEDAVTRVNAHYYVDQQLSLDTEKTEGEIPAIPATMLQTSTVPVTFLDFTPKGLDLGDHPIDYDPPGIRLAVLSDGRVASGAIVLTDFGKRIAIEAKVFQAIADKRRPFRLGGSMIYTLRCDRTALIDGLTQGQYGVVEARKLVDPRTNVRLGARLVRLTAINFVDGREAVLTCYDIGPVDDVPADDGTDDPPSTGTPSTTDPPELDNFVVDPDVSTAVDVDWAKNAAGDAIVFRIAETATTVASIEDVPADAWYQAGQITIAGASGSTGFASLGGPRIWLQARSEPGLGTESGTSAQPSEWVSPLNADYVDLDTLNPPTDAAVSNVTDSTATFSWTPADTVYPLEVWYVPSTVVNDESVLGAGWKLATLPQGSVDLSVGGLAGPGADVTLAVRHVDPESGRVSSFAIVNFTTAGAGTLVAPRMAGIGLVGDA